MNKLTKQEYKNIENKLNYDHMVNGKNALKMSKLLQKNIVEMLQLLKVNTLD